MIRAPLFLSVGIILASLASTQATPQLKLSDGTTTIIVTDGDANDQSSAAGAVFYNGPVGANWYVNVTVGITKPVQGSPSQPYMDLDTQDVSHGAGDLTLQFTETGFTATPGSFDAEVGGNSDGNVEFKYYIDGSNTPFGTGTQLADFIGLIDVFTGSSNGTYNVTAPFSMTVEADIHHTGAGSTGFDEQLILTNSTPPTIQCPGDRDLGCNPTSIPDCDTNSVVVTAECGVANITCSSSDSASGCIHERDIIYTVFDNCGQSNTCTQRIFWKADTDAPNIGALPDINLTVCDTNCATGTYTGSATDGCGSATVTFSPPSGTCFAVGTNSVTATATDLCGNKATKTFKVIVTASGCFTTYTPGGWFAPPNGNNPGMLLKKNFASVYPSGLVVGGTYTIKFNGSANVDAFAPGGQPGVLKHNYVNPTAKTEAGEFAAQVIALKLNVDFSAAGILASGLGGLHIATGYTLAGSTVNDVLTLVNKVLGGNTAALPAGVTVASLTTLLGQINGDFDGGVVNNGVLVP